MIIKVRKYFILISISNTPTCRPKIPIVNYSDRCTYVCSIAPAPLKTTHPHLFSTPAHAHTLFICTNACAFVFRIFQRISWPAKLQNEVKLDNVGYIALPYAADLHIYPRKTACCCCCLGFPFENMCLQHAKVMHIE